MSNWATQNKPLPTTFIQWKGTELCADFYCICGKQFHIDAEFCCAVQCPFCSRRYELSTRLDLRQLTETEVWDGCEIRIGLK